MWETFVLLMNFCNNFVGDGLVGSWNCRTQSIKPFMDMSAFQCKGFCGLV